MEPDGSGLSTDRTPLQGRPPVMAATKRSPKHRLRSVWPAFEQSRAMSKRRLAQFAAL